MYDIKPAEVTVGTISWLVHMTSNACILWRSQRETQRSMSAARDHALYTGQRASGALSLVGDADINMFTCGR